MPAPAILASSSIVGAREPTPPALTMPAPPAPGPPTAVLDATGPPQTGIVGLTQEATSELMAIMAKSAPTPASRDRANLPMA